MFSELLYGVCAEESRHTEESIINKNKYLRIGLRIKISSTKVQKY